MSDLPIGSRDAFPVPAERGTTRGLTIRQYLIGQALAGLTARPFTEFQTGGMNPRTALAQIAIEHADAVLRELESEGR